MTVKKGQMRQDKAAKWAVTVLYRYDGNVRYSYTEETPAGFFSGKDDLPHNDFERRFPILRGDFGAFR